MNQLSQPSEGYHTLVEDTSDMIRIIEQKFFDLASVLVVDCVCEQEEPF